MSSSEGQPRDGQETSAGWKVQNLGIAESDISEFSKSTSSQGLNLDLLFNATGRYKNGEFRGAYGRNRGEHETFAPVVGAYNTWLAERDTARARHSEYVKLIQDRPGRAGTVLVPGEQKKNATLLTPEDAGQITVLE